MCFQPLNFFYPRKNRGRIGRKFLCDFIRFDSCSHRRSIAREACGRSCPKASGRDCARGGRERDGAGRVARARRRFEAESMEKYWHGLAGVARAWRGKTGSRNDGSPPAGSPSQSCVPGTPRERLATPPAPELQSSPSDSGAFSGGWQKPRPFPAASPGQNRGGAKDACWDAEDAKEAGYIDARCALFRSRALC
jgi:hypothetical protein